MKYLRFVVFILCFLGFTTSSMAKPKAKNVDRRGILLQHNTKSFKKKFVREGRIIHVVLKDSSHSILKGKLLIIDKETVKVGDHVVALSNIHYLNHSSAGATAAGVLLAVPGTLMFLGGAIILADEFDGRGDSLDSGLGILIGLIYIAPGAVLSAAGYPLIFMKRKRDLTYEWSPQIIT